MFLLRQMTGTLTEHPASGGRVKFSFNALPSTSVEFAFEVMAPSAADGYLCISVESSSQVQWRVPQSENWAWQTCSQQHTVAAGMHTLTIHACGHGTRLRQVRVHSGNVVLLDGDVRWRQVVRRGAMLDKTTIGAMLNYKSADHHVALVATAARDPAGELVHRFAIGSGLPHLDIIEQDYHQFS